jgi:hypothetical protein
MKTDKNIYPVPTPSVLPKANGIINDLSFNTSILRVTDEGDGKYCNNAYSYWPTFNCDNSKIYVLIDNNAYVYDFNPLTFQVNNKKALFESIPGGGWPSIEDAIWSGTNPNVIFVHYKMRIYSYNINNRTYALVADLSSKVSQGNNLQQMTKSLDDRVFGFNLQFTDWANIWNRVGCLVWNAADNSIYTYIGIVDEVELSKGGDYLIRMTGQQGKGVIEGTVVDLITKIEYNLTDDRPDLCPGHKDCGFSLVVGEDNWENTINARPFNSPHTFVPILKFNNDWSQGKHISMLGDDENWALVSTFTANGLLSTGLFKDELFLVSTDGQENVKRIAHHHSTLYSEYWNSPRADISRNGQFVAFTSNWGNQTRRDVFIAKVFDSTPVVDKRFSLMDTYGKVIGEGRLY